MSLSERLRRAAQAVLDAKGVQQYEMACEEYSKLATPANIVAALTQES